MGVKHSRFLIWNDVRRADHFVLPILAGLGAGLAFWIFAAVVEAFPHQRSLSNDFFHPLPDRLLTRLIVILGCVVFTTTYALLRKSAHKLRFTQLAVDNSADSIFWADSDGRIKYANSVVVERYGYTREELLCLTIADLDPLMPAEAWKPYFEELKQNGRSRSESFHRTKSGETFPVEITANYIASDGGDLICGNVRDTSERKAAHEALKKSEGALALAQRIARIGSYDWDVTSGKVEFSDEMSYLLGMGMGEVHLTTAEAFFGFFHPEDRSRVRKTLEQDFRAKRPHESEQRIIQASGAEIWVSYQGEFIFDAAGNILRMFGTMQDITENKRAALELKRYANELTESNRLKDIFTDVLRHDILNPISAIQASAEFLVRSETDPRKTKLLKNMQKSISNLIEMTENAAKFAKVATTKSMEFSPLDLNCVLRDALHDFGPQLKKKKVVIDFAPSEESLADVNPMIKDVFTNLISNAIKYGPENSRIGINIEEKGDSWVVSVADYGPGISDENKKRIFNRFERIEKECVKGSGLGLAIVAQVVSMHGGKIWIEDNPKGGSIFCVRLLKKQLDLCWRSFSSNESRIMNFDEAIQAHSAWKLKLAAYLRKPDGSIKETDIESDNKCPLGRWIYGDGTKYSGLAEYEALKAEHIRFHKAAADIVKKADSGQNIAEDTTLGSESAFGSASSSVVAAIMTMERKAELKSLL